MTGTVLPSEFGAVFPTRAVERELKGLLKLAAQVSEIPVRRVHMSNLVAYCDRMETALQLAEQVPDIAAVHPARVLLLVRDAAATGSQITAAVSVRFRTLGRGQEACSEQITLHAPPSAADRLPFLMRRFLIGDLPTNVWWSSTVPPPMAGPLLYELAEHAQQVIYDSIGWPDPPRGVAATGVWLEDVERHDAGRWRVASDLNWRRLKYWRRLMAQALDEASAPGAADSITELTIEHGPHAVVQAWSLAAWLSQRLSWTLQDGVVRPNIEISWRFRKPQGEATVRVQRLPEGPPVLSRVGIACTLNGKPVVMNFAAQGDFRLGITVEGSDSAARTVTVPPLTPAELIGRQLSDRDPDPVFRESMVVAQAMARSVIK
jgi:glucose-6-phosphate dehydrogenase assembly protein OpcA